MNRPIEEYVKHAAELAQEVVNTWGMVASVGHGASLSSDFRALFEKTETFRRMRKTADSHRRCKIVTAEMEAEERAAELEFAKAYKSFRERHERN